MNEIYAIFGYLGDFVLILMFFAIVRSNWTANSFLHFYKLHAFSRLKFKNNCKEALSNEKKNLKIFCN